MDAEHLFAIAREGPKVRIYRAAKTGAPMVEVGALTSANGKDEYASTGLVSEGGYLYWGGPSGIVAWSKSGGGAPIVRVPAAPGHVPTSLVTDGAALYWIERFSVGFVGRLWRYALPNGPALALDAAHDWWAPTYGLAVVGTKLYGGLRGESKVRVVSSVTGAFEQDFAAPQMTSLFSDGAALYFWTQDGLGNDRKIYKSDLDGSALSELDGSVPFPEGPPVFSGGHFYYAFRTASGWPFNQFVAKVPRGGGSWSKLSELGSDTHLLTADGASIYFHAVESSANAAPFFARAAQ